MVAAGAECTPGTRHAELRNIYYERRRFIKLCNKLRGVVRLRAAKWRNDVIAAKWRNCNDVTSLNRLEPTTVEGGVSSAECVLVYSVANVSVDWLSLWLRNNAVGRISNMPNDIYPLLPCLQLSLRFDRWLLVCRSGGN